MIKKNCFAYRFGKCDALNMLYCETECCSFFKPADAIKPCTEEVDAILAGVMYSPKAVKDDCEYYIGKEKYCSATSCDTCSRCKFYSPKMPAKAKMLAKLYATEKQIADKAAARARILEAELDRIFDEW